MTSPAAVINKYETGPKTYEVVELVQAGQCVEYRAGTPTQPGLSLVGVGAAGSTRYKFAGVATRYANTKANIDAWQSGTSPDGFVQTYSARETEAVAVIKRGEVPIKYAASATYGQPVKLAATGQVTPAVGDGTDDHLIIGTCQVQAGVASGAVGMTWINAY